ncbi:MAG: hypothetical protein P9L94_17030 [Candidatus Hinthialibacter antarcticus]|nr:hypothetical protein [Candidatus Hinthialibacter antarcticus]
MIQNVRLFSVLGVFLSVAVMLTACGGGGSELVKTQTPDTYLLVLSPFNQEVADAIEEYAAPVNLKVVEDADYQSPNFLAKVKWDTRQERVFGRAYQYKKKEEKTPSDNRWKLSSLWGSISSPFGGTASSNQIFEINSDMTFSDYRTYELPTVLTYEDQETAEAFTRMIAKSAQWVREGDRRAIPELYAAKRIRALEDLNDRIARIEGAE